MHGELCVGGCCCDGFVYVYDECVYLCVKWCIVGCYVWETCCLCCMIVVLDCCGMISTLMHIVFDGHHKCLLFVVGGWCCVVYCGCRFLCMCCVCLVCAYHELL